jgi:hypothetical protein
MGANAHCRYAAHIQFLAKNTLTTRNDTLSSYQSPSLRSQDHGEGGDGARASPLSQVGHGDVQLPTEATHHVATGLNISNDNDDSAPITSKDDAVQITGPSLPWDQRWPMVGKCSLNDDEIELLRHYSQFVAPWVSLFRCFDRAPVHFDSTG